MRRVLEMNAGHPRYSLPPRRPIINDRPLSAILKGLQTLHIERRKWMKNIQSSSAGGYPEFSERHEQSTHQFETKHCKTTTESDQIRLDYLIDIGFAWEEAITLLNMRERLYDNAEMHQRMADDHRIQFVQWLYAHGEISEN
jgi:hypothetical protein